MALTSPRVAQAAHELAAAYFDETGIQEIGKPAVSSSAAIDSMLKPLHLLEVLAHTSETYGSRSRTTRTRFNAPSPVLQVLACFITRRPRVERSNGLCPLYSKGDFMREVPPHTRET